MIRLAFMIHLYMTIMIIYDKIPTWNVPGMSSAVRFARIAAWSQWIILTRPLCSNDGNQVLVARNCD
jgi:hypothetical protein